MERRRTVRVDTSIGLECRMPATPQRVVIRDLSLEGCRIETRRPAAEVGTTVRIDINRRMSVTGTIVWTDGNEAGVRFARPLDLESYAVVDWIESAEPGLSFRLTIDPPASTRAA